MVLSAPSGAGKHTVINHVRAMGVTLVETVSATTRPPRPNEREGEDYYFLSPEGFRARVEAGEFVEWAEVHGNRYGTLRAELERCLAAGGDVIMELDVAGKRSLCQLRPDTVSVFLAAPSMAALEARLRTRGADDEASIQVRLENAREEMTARWEYDYLIVNERVDDAAADLAAILRAERCRTARLEAEQKEL